MDERATILDVTIDWSIRDGDLPVAIMVADGEGCGVLDDIQRNTSTADWSLRGNWQTYRGIPVELHDEWSWGWMLRTAAGFPSYDRRLVLAEVDRRSPQTSPSDTLLREDEA